MGVLPVTNTNLIAKLESASEGSRELSDAVLLACGWVQQRAYRNGPLLHWHDPIGRAVWGAPAVTTSLDAARALVPEGWQWDVSSFGDACLTDMKGRFLIEGDTEIYGRAATPELALCAAVLRSKEQPGNG